MPEPDASEPRDVPEATASSTPPPAADDGGNPAAFTPPATPIRANVSGGWLWRPVVIGLALLVWTVLCIKDGVFTYPADNAAYAELVAFQDSNPDWRTEWSAYAAERGLPTEPNDIEPHAEWNIATQYIMAAICLPLGLLALFHGLSHLGRYVEADAEGVRDKKGRGGRWSDLTTINDSRWDRKGISTLSFVPGYRGETDSVRLDDWKFDREGTKAIHELAVASRRS